MTTLTSDGTARVLADGNEIPLLGLGVWQVPDGRECEEAVEWALEAGYRHIDTAQAYRNEASVGRALRASGVPRDEVYITTKFYPGRRDPEAEAQRSLERLGVDRVDLYIIHWPQGGPTWAWKGMQARPRTRIRALDRRVELQRRGGGRAAGGRRHAAGGQPGAVQVRDRAARRTSRVADPADRALGRAADPLPRGLPAPLRRRVQRHVPGLQDAAGHGLAPRRHPGAVRRPPAPLPPGPHAHAASRWSARGRCCCSRARSTCRAAS